MIFSSVLENISVVSEVNDKKGGILRIQTTPTPEGLGRVFKHAIDGDKVGFNLEAWAVIATFFRPVIVKVTTTETGVNNPTTLKFTFLVHEDTELDILANTALRAAIEAGDPNLQEEGVYPLIDTMVIAADLDQKAHTRSAGEVSNVVSRNPPTALAIMDTSSTLLADGNLRRNPLASWKWKRFTGGDNTLGLKRQPPRMAAKGPHLQPKTSLR